MDIKAARRSDLRTLMAVHDAAFGTPNEGRLVADLMAADLDAISLVASDDKELPHAFLGHILFRPLLVEIDGEAIAALAPAPLAVMPGRQRQGVGTALVKTGLAQARAEGMFGQLFAHAANSMFGSCAALQSGPGCEATDQRGQPRSTAKCDLGAVEIP